MTALTTTMASGSTSTGDSSCGGGPHTNKTEEGGIANDDGKETFVSSTNAQPNAVQYSPRRMMSKLKKDVLVKTKSTGHEGLETDENLLSLVYPKLYLGSLAAACDVKLLKKLNVTNILTIDSCPLPNKITDLPFVKTKFIQVSDMPREDVLHHFEESYDFIESAISNENCGNVLVHCYFGVSRSATIVLAYFMKKLHISLEEAQSRLKSRRSSVGPNYGFLSQLKLYEKMNFSIDKSNILYKRFRLHVAADKIKSVQVLPPPYTDVIKHDPAPLTVHPEPVVYRCRRCRRILASASNLLTHMENKSPVWFDFGSTSGCPSGSSEESTPSSVETSQCTQMYFIEPLVWMKNVAHSLQGKLYCPNQNCKSKLGSFSWVMGCLCPCGAKVQPAFYLIPSKVDRSTSVLNIQITI